MQSANRHECSVRCVLFGGRSDDGLLGAGAQVEDQAQVVEAARA